ncbi:MAG: sporulation integral membrane protein YtvI [Oscillospiraceae bacterium]|jgi:sporulation integral membrane protein YtvI|nr:sporulation integral membrane protein YtvI [Oscillospiraceae bacterium]
MNDKTFESRCKFVVTGFFLIMLGLAFYGAIKYVLPLILPFVVGFVLAMLLQRPINYLSKKTPFKKGFWAAIIVLLLVFAVGYLFYLAGSRIYEQLQGLTNYITQKLQDFPAFLGEVEKTILDLCRILPEKLQEGARTSVGDFFTNMMDKYSNDDGSMSFGWQEILQNPPDIAWIKTPLAGVLGTAKRVPILIVGIILTIVATIFTAADYDRLIGFIKRQLPKEKRHSLSLVKRTVGSSVAKLLKSYVTIMCITFIEMSVSLTLAKLFHVYDGGYTIAIALIVAVVDILPVLGTGSVVIPWAIVSFATGKTGLGIWLLVTFGIITAARQYIEPKLVAENLGLPPVLTLCAMYVGVQLFGFVGMFLLPMTLMLIKVLNDQGVLRLWKSGKRKKNLVSKGNIKKKKGTRHEEI